jgi:hypothetical protein
MTINATLVKHGTAGGVTINADISRIDHSVSVKVLLSAPYIIQNSPGIPTRPGLTGASAANLDYPRTLASGTVQTFLAHEAAALVAAGKASLV